MKNGEKSRAQNTTADAGAWLAGGGAMGDLIRSKDWSAAAIGPIESWPQSLRTALRICLHSRYPMFVWWGPALTNFYNDAYIPVLGKRHPAAIGQPAAEIWRDIWDVVGPQAEIVMTAGRSTWNEQILLVMQRHGFTEETYFTFSYSPVHDDDGNVAGVFCACTEETTQVLAERRVRSLRALAARAGEARTVEDAAASAGYALDQNRFDVPFALLYLTEEAGGARLAVSTGLPPDSPATARAVSLAAPAAGRGWPIGEALESGELLVLDDVEARIGVPLPGGAWPEPTARAAVLPIAQPGQERATGALVVGLSPRLAFDDDYEGFLRLVAGHIGSAIANARAYEHERRRAEALAEIDRAKTRFFSNVSHEFRTPLTLMLGPTEDALASPDRALRGEDLDTLYRNELRLLKLVNTLLDFSRIEAGRARASFEQTDLERATCDLASTFRSAVERAGLRYTVACHAPEPVHVDREMWEKIVLNLLSNALKFTFEGGIDVILEDAPGQVILVVRDTGIGIDAPDLPRIFERFHRVEGSRARTHEGSGIGLTLVQDLVRLHGGTITVSSEVGRGSTFTVTLPKGTRHLPEDHIVAPRPPSAGVRRPNAFVEEALRWLPDARGVDDGSVHEAVAPVATPALGRTIAPGRVLIADDNADMRGYLTRLLRRHWSVEAVGDGEAALEAVRRRAPDLVLADVMMPGLDGFELLRELRSDERTSGIPVVMLSARAGEEARVEGLNVGADDYLVKPFSARELVARVNAQMTLAANARERSLLLAREQEARREAQAANRAKDEFLAMLGHELRNPLAPILTALQLIKLRGPHPAEREHAIIERQVKQLVALVDDLLDVARIASGRVDLRRESVEAASVVARAIEMASPLLEQQRHQLTVDVPRPGLVIDADPSRLAQVVANLLTNAAKYTEPGGSIAVSAEAVGREVVLRVRDTGIGIDASMLPRIFDLFAQERQTLERSRGGLGLGLAIAKNLVVLHGGSITATSEGRGRGAEFEVRLPRVEAGVDEAAVADRATLARPERRAGRVLVVDDNRDAAALLSEMLRAFGYAARSVHDAPSALSAAEELDPDVAILDLGLPVMDGFELARRLAEHPRLRRARLIAVTGYGQEHDRRRSAAAGFHAHLVKPVDADQLRTAVEAALAATRSDQS